jgi:hypothetical protein
MSRLLSGSSCLRLHDPAAAPALAPLKNVGSCVVAITTYP